MKVTVGTDIIEVERIKNAIQSNIKFAETVFTCKEIEYCESKNLSKYEHYAARFAAKEAVFKAISNSLENKYSISWKNVEVQNDENGRPRVNFLRNKPRELKNIEISLSHCKTYAVATVVATW